MVGRRKGLVRYRDVVQSTFDLKEVDARKGLISAVGSKRLTMSEPARGSTVGAPDMWLFRGQEYGWLPIELKVSFKYLHNYQKRDEPRYVQVRHVQPAQVNWHTQQQQVGSTAIILVMINPGMSWESMHWAIVLGSEIRNWKEGMRIYQTCFGIDLAEALGCDGAVY